MLNMARRTGVGKSVLGSSLSRNHRCRVAPGIEAAFCAAADLLSNERTAKAVIATSTPRARASFLRPCGGLAAFRMRGLWPSQAPAARPHPIESHSTSGPSCVACGAEFVAGNRATKLAELGSTRNVEAKNAKAFMTSWWALTKEAAASWVNQSEIYR